MCFLVLDLQNSEEGQRRRGSYNVHHYDRNEWELKHTIKVSQVLSLPWRKLEVHFRKHVQRLRESLSICCAKEVENHVRITFTEMITFKECMLLSSEQTDLYQGFAYSNRSDIYLRCIPTYSGRFLQQFVTRQVQNMLLSRQNTHWTKIF